MRTLSQVLTRIQGAIEATLRADIPSLALDRVRWDQDLYVYHHLGLGDMIHCNGMVRHLLSLLDPHRSIHVFCKARNASMTRWMYRDEPRIRVLEVDAREPERIQVQRWLHRTPTHNFLSVGHRELRPLLQRHPDRFFDELFYLQVGIPYACRFTDCYWERERDEEERVFAKCWPGEPYAFVHDDPARGYRVDTAGIDLPIVRNDPSESLFHMGLILERAAEVHCMESSIRCMMESLELGDCRLAYHNFRYPDRPLGTATRLNWVSIEYVQKGSAVGALCRAS